MGLFDKKPGEESFGDKLIQGVVKTASDLIEKPFMDEAVNRINDAAELMTESLEAIKEGKEVPEEPSHTAPRNGLPDFDALGKNWDRLFDEIEDKELGKYKVCPSCKEAVSSENQFCPKCGARLPEHTAAVRICPYCGTKNRALNFRCTGCGKELPLSENGKEAAAQPEDQNE